MSDASKRLRDQRDIDLDEQWEPVEDRLNPSKMSNLQEPILAKPETSSLKVDLPPGISCLADWSTTICRLPKVQEQGMTYAELVASREHQGYLTRIQQHGKGCGGKFEDFARYLEAIKFADSKGYSSDPQQTYPNSCEPRKKK